MESYQQVYNTLHQLNIPFEDVEHPPAFTTEEADHYITGKEGVRTKSLFLCNKKRTSYYLVIMDDAKRLDMDKLANLLDEKRLSFCSSEKLIQKMKTTPGEVSIFGLLNNDDRDIQVYFDKAILAESIMTFHPNDNTKTLFIATSDMFTFIESLGYRYHVVDL
ncbi:prolyl-tRNA synthetase associated domain-containing protein [Bacillus rubiinfantis]|uniref:prolyl-tRNA synthetase associated domain-containing protein n=1 Tax=Bacillus rubiinfantis TaxID=1499680 RepID=UPI0005A87037|nr:prolyl-tRNA synthetase associated domain-containing protein [Bacillus rubiinfantis]